MKLFSALTRAALIASVLIGASAQSAALVASDPTQFGRLSRNGIPQDWSLGEPFPGVVNPTIQYHYHVYAYNVGLNPFVQFSIDSTSAFTFFSAYQTVYSPTNLSYAWLGDAGGSGNFNFDNVPANLVDPRFFQVVAGINTTVLLVVNESTPNAGIGQPFNVLVEAFPDSSFNFDPVVLLPTANPIPEPSTLLLLGLAPVALLARRRSRRRPGDLAA